MIDYFIYIMGKFDFIVNNLKQSDFIGKKGIIVVKGYGWSNVRGYVILWNGSICLDQCYLLNDLDNGLFVFEVGILWILL